MGLSLGRYQPMCQLMWVLMCGSLLCHACLFRFCDLQRSVSLPIAMSSVIKIDRIFLEDVLDVVKSCRQTPASYSQSESRTPHHPTRRAFHVDLLHRRYLNSVSTTHCTCSGASRAIDSSDDHEHGIASAQSCQAIQCHIQYQSGQPLMIQAGHSFFDMA
jgi:hypothetical protein